MKYTKRIEDVPLYDAPRGEPQRSVGVMIDPVEEDKLAMGFFILPAGKKSEPDYHDVDEAYYITKGSGYGHLWVRGEDREPERYEVNPGTSVFIPATVKHQMFNTGKEDIWLVWFFPHKPKVSGKLQKVPFSPKTWVRRGSRIKHEWHQ